MIERIISGGQTGADRGGLDAAIELGIEHGGTCPKGRTAEDGIVPLRYKLVECERAGYPPRTHANVRDSDATVLFTVGATPSTGTRLTIRFCTEMERQMKHINLEVGREEALNQLREWLDDCESFGRPVRTLNVAGTRESKSPGIQRMVQEVLVTALSGRN